MHTKSAGVSRPVVVVGNQSRYKSRPLNTTKVSIAGAYDLLLNLLREISYVSTRSEQIANANLSMSEAFSRPVNDKDSDFSSIIALPYEFLALHKDNDQPSEGK